MPSASKRRALNPIPGRSSRSGARQPALLQVMRSHGHPVVFGVVLQGQVVQLLPRLLNSEECGLEGGAGSEEGMGLTKPGCLRGAKDSEELSGFQVS